MGLIKNHLKKMARNAIGGKLGSLLDGAFNDKISGSAVSLGKNFAKLKEQANYVFEENEYSFGSLSFPSDLASETTSNGHYMIFYINVPEEEMENGNSERGRIVGKDLGDISTQVNGGKIRSLNAAIQGRQQRKRTTNVISLYMPPEISVTYGADYAGEDIGSVARQVDNFADFQFAEEMTAFVRNNIAGAADTAAPGIVALRQAATGIAVNNRLELTFKAINQREFNYTFKFMPKNKEEADEIQNILYMFKYHMHPTIIGSSNSPVFRVPSIFNIHYMYRGDENKYLNTQTDTVLQNMEVKYGEGDVFKTYRGNENGAPPSVITMTLSFKELDIQDKRTIYKHELPPGRKPAGNVDDTSTGAPITDTRRPDVL